MTDETNTNTDDASANPAPATAAVAPPVAAPTPQPAQPAAQPSPDLKAVADALLAEVPEKLRGLIPQIDPAGQIQWFANAKQTGVFETGAPVVANTDSGKPTVTPVEPNLEDLPATARMARGYGQ